MSNTGSACAITQSLRKEKNNSFQVEKTSFKLTGRNVSHNETSEILI